MGRSSARKALLAAFAIGLLLGGLGLPTASHAIVRTDTTRSMVGEALALAGKLRFWSQLPFDRYDLPPDYCETRKRARALIRLMEDAYFKNPTNGALIVAGNALADAEAHEHYEWDYYCPECEDWYNDDPCDCWTTSILRGSLARPLYDWSGFYIGINGGGATGRTMWDEPGSSTGFFDVRGSLFGGTAGFNWQKGSWVVGLEGTIDATNISGVAPRNCFGCTTANTYLGTLDGRFGYAFGNVLPFIKGGAAFGNIQQKVGGFPGTDEQKVGWNAAVGIEWAFKPQWSLKVEVNHYDLGSVTCTPITCGGTATTPLTIDTYTLGLNFKIH